MIDIGEKKKKRHTPNLEKFNDFIFPNAGGMGMYIYTHRHTRTHTSANHNRKRDPAMRQNTDTDVKTFIMGTLVSDQTVRN